ncbi:MAG: glycosyltransferase family 9 protein [Candidatus Woesearchaeota archaeon]|jgi:heptosyltransferase-2
MAAINLIKFIDKYVGAILISILQFFTSKKQISANDKNVLVVRIWTLGESLLVIPILKKLKEKGYHVTVLVSNRSKLVFERLNFVDEILSLEKKADLLKSFKKYDVAIDTEPYENISALLSWFFAKKTIGYGGLFRDRMYSHKIKYDDSIHTSTMIAKLLEPFNIRFIPKELIPIKFTKNEKEEMDVLLKKKFISKLGHGKINKKIVGIHASTAESSPWRSWKKERFAELSDKLTKKGFIVIFTGSKSEHSYNEKILSIIKNKEIVFNFAGETTLYELSYLLTKCDVFISNDTGPMHLSASMGTKTIGLFGPNLPERFSPLGKNNVAIYNSSELSCSPCINVHKGEFKNCKINGKCMDLITVEDVYDAVLKLLKM